MTAGCPRGRRRPAAGPVVQTRETQLRYIVRETAALLYYRLTHASVDTETSGLG